MTRSIFNKKLICKTIHCTWFRPPFIIWGAIFTILMPPQNILVCGSSISNEILSGIKSNPKIMEEIGNITVTAGREAHLPCVVESLGDHRVGWLKVETQTILSLQKRVVTHNNRILVNHDEHRTWSLRIKNVKKTDKGCYMCQINTPVMINKIGCIVVHVPPNIVDTNTSSETTINEGENVDLVCNAEGYPEPKVYWQREDKRGIKSSTGNNREFIKMEKVEGEKLTLMGVTRRQMGAFLCIAKNGVPPIVSKRIQLNVNFAPVVKVSNQLIGAPLGTEVEIECYVEAFPLAINYWQRNNSEMLLNGHEFNLIEDTQGYKTVLKLQIKNFLDKDEGNYKCMSTNSFGTSDTNIKLYVINVPSPKSTTELHTTNHHSHPSTLSPSNSGGVNSMDLLKREEKQMLKNYNGAGGYNPLDLGDNDRRYREKQHKFNYDYDKIHGMDDTLFDQDIGFSHSTYQTPSSVRSYVVVLVILFFLL